MPLVCTDTDTVYADLITSSSTGHELIVARSTIRGTSFCVRRNAAFPFSTFNACFLAKRSEHVYLVQVFHADSIDVTLHSLSAS